jgi:hypothetical protein
MLTVAARITDAAARDQFADRLAHRARITEEVVRAEIRKAAVQRQTTVETRRMPALTELKPAEKGLIWALLHQPASGVEALADLEDGDLTGLASEAILRQARSLQGLPPESIPSTLVERLTQGEAVLLAELGRPTSAPAQPADCVQALRKRRWERERADVQREIDRLQELGGAGYDDEIVTLWARKRALVLRIEEIGSAAAPARAPESVERAAGSAGGLKNTFR